VPPVLLQGYAGLCRHAEILEMVMREHRLALCIPKERDVPLFPPLELMFLSLGGARRKFT
jgi:hypothetical protein